MATPMLRLPNGRTVEWDGPWPPPERLLLCEGEEGRLFFTDEETLAVTGVTTVEQLREVVNVTSLRRVSYSTLPDEVNAHPHVVRAAEYELEEGAP